MRRICFRGDPSQRPPPEIFRFPSLGRMCALAYDNLEEPVSDLGSELAREDFDDSVLIARGEQLDRRGKKEDPVFSAGRQAQLRRRLFGTQAIEGFVVQA